MQAAEEDRRVMRPLHGKRGGAMGHVSEVLWRNVHSSGPAPPSIDKDAPTLPRTNMDVDHCLFAEEHGLPRGHAIHVSLLVTGSVGGREVGPVPVRLR